LAYSGFSAINYYNKSSGQIGEINKELIYKLHESLNQSFDQAILKEMEIIQ
jgi:hypothetical protein